MFSAGLQELAANNTKGCEMAVCSTDTPACARQTAESHGSQCFCMIMQLKPSSCCMHRKDCEEFVAATILLLFQKSEATQGIIFFTESLCLGLQIFSSSTDCRFLNREIKVNRILPPRDQVLPGKSYSLRR